MHSQQGDCCPVFWVTNSHWNGFVEHFFVFLARRPSCDVTTSLEAVLLELQRSGSRPTGRLFNAASWEAPPYLGSLPCD